MEIKSTVFKNKDLIPAKYTCNGKDISPPLTWGPIPKGTKSLALIVDDPDAPMGTWDHWIIFNLPPETTGLKENIQTFPDSVRFGKNSWNRNNYGGPCPPDKEHRYFFKLYALNTMLNLQNGASKIAILQAMEGHVLEETEIIGRYDQPRE